MCACVCVSVSVSVSVCVCVCVCHGCRAKNKALGLAGQVEVLIGHLYNHGQFFGGHCRNCAENGQWPAAVLSSVGVTSINIHSFLCPPKEQQELTSCIKGV